MKITLLLLTVATLVGLMSGRDIPLSVAKPIPNVPSLEYEIVKPAQPNLKKLDENPQPNGNQTFTYDPASGKWTAIKPSDPVPKEGTLTWNQNNDKWLTQSFWAKP